jgi:hypothetical protein
MFRESAFAAVLGIMTIVAAGAAAQEAFPLGEPRDDLARFHGLYGDASDPNGRNFFVTEAVTPPFAEQAPQIPPGYIMIGPMWADVAPWYMKSLSETRFEQQWLMPGAETILVEFKLDNDGNAVALTFDTVFTDRGRLERLGDLPEGFCSVAARRCTGSPDSNCRSLLDVTTR